MDYRNYLGYQDPEKDMSKLKDKRGAHKTESLFNETIQMKSRLNYEPLYSLRDYDYKGYYSAYQIYMNSIDERDAALKLVGSMAHWRKLLQLAWFMNGRPECQFEGIAQWREDMAQRDSTEAKRVIMDACQENNVPAARALEQLSKGKKKNKTKKVADTSGDSNVTDFLKKFQGSQGCD